MLSFIRRHLDPVDLLAEILFGLIMALGFSGAVQLGLATADNRALFISILGCNLAWAIVDGVIYALTALFERGRQARVAHDLLHLADEETALRKLADELDDPLIALMSAEQRRQLYRWILERIRERKLSRARLQAEDLLGALAVTLIVVLATLPVVLPFVLIESHVAAIRISNGIALTFLWLLGMQWGRMVGESPWRIAGGLSAVGVALVIVTVLLTP